jgi:hypothetical protein
MVAVEDAVIVEMVIRYADRSVTRNRALYKLDSDRTEQKRRKKR